ncbi:hypothetical protein GCM10028857_06410 [Salinarchaeum chitinilyticum]
MLDEAALRVLEMVGVLLSILFVGMQFASRHSNRDAVSDETLRYALENIEKAALFLLLASSAAISVYFSIHGTQPAWQMFIPLFLALVLITNAIRHSTREMRASLEPDENDDSLNTDQPESRNTEEDRE